MKNNKKTFVVEFKMSQEEISQFTVTIKDASDIQDAMFKAVDVARLAMNVSPYDDSPVVKSISERGW